uniref:CCHC-type domain-containing protein n=1 Tax=Tanacetum cinerariifolium TaxID=118510 RepID=A0A6L2JC90_TANCI|nr:hypothetical protein [Tanacetum cinerariifolium]
MQTQTSNTLHNAIMKAGGKDRPPMLAPGNYVQCLKVILKQQLKDKVVPVSEGSSETTTKRYIENYKNVSQDIRGQLNAEDEAVQIILTGIDNDIYSTVDACPNARKMWKAIERFYNMMNELVRNQCDVTNHQVNVQFLLQLQPEWQRSQQAATRNKGKAIVNSHIPIYDQDPSMVADDDEMSKDKEIDKLMALIYLSFKKIYKLTNNNLRTSSNTSNVAGTRETVGTTVVRKSGIQCYNCKEFRHVARECQKPKRAKDAAYHKEKMILCKQEEVGFQLNTEQADWRDDTDNEPEDQELEAHYMNKMHKAFPLPGESSHWQYKFPLPVEGVPTARRIKIPLPGVCTAMMKKLPDNYSKVYKFQSQQRRPMTKKQKKEYYMAVEDFIPMDSKEESKRLKRKGLNLEKEQVKNQKSSEEAPGIETSIEEFTEEKMKEMMQLVPVKDVHVQALQVKHPIIDWKVHTEDLLKQLDKEDLNQLWALVKEYLSIRPTTNNKEIELWVELKRMYEPDPEDQLWTLTQNFMHAPVEWKLYDLSGVHHLTAKDKEIFMLVEKDYPLRKGLALVMISYKLQVENYSQMAEDLIRKIYNIANTLRQQGIKCTRHSHCQVKCSHWQYKFPLPVKVVATAGRLEMPLPEVCTAIEEKKKKLPFSTTHIKHLMAKETKKLVEGSENVEEHVEVNSLPLRNDDNQTVLGTRLEPRSDKESPEVEKISDMLQPVNVIEEKEESVEDDYELRSRGKRKHVENIKNIPSPTTTRSHRILTILIPSNTKKLKELTEKLQGLDGYLFEHLSAKFMPRRKFHELAKNLEDIMMEAFPKLVYDRIKVLLKKQVPLYVAKGLILEREKRQADVAKMITEAIQQERKNLRLEISSQVNDAIANHIPLQVDSSVWSYMTDHILHVHLDKDTTLSPQEQQYQLYLTMKDDLRPSAVHPRDHDDPHDDAHVERENSAKRQKTSEHGTFEIEGSSFVQDYESKPDDVIPNEKVSQELVDEILEIVDEAKLRKVVDEMLRQQCTSGDEHQYHIDQMQNFLKNKQERDQCSTISTKAHSSRSKLLRDPKAPRLPLVDKFVKRFNLYAHYEVKHWNNPHAKIFYIKNQQSPRRPKKEIYSNLKKSHQDLLGTSLHQEYNDLGRVYNFQLGVESYQQQVNLTVPTIIFPGIEKYKVFSIVSELVYGIIF